VDGLRLVVARSPRAYAAPALVLLAVTLAVVVLHSTRHTAAPTTPAAKAVVAKKAVVPERRWYRVAAGDTLAGIAGKMHVPLATIRTLNPSLQPTALYIGEKIRLR
jgi:LysM repeat protein